MTRHYIHVPHNERCNTMLHVCVWNNGTAMEQHMYIVHVLVVQCNEWCNDAMMGERLVTSALLPIRATHLCALKRPTPPPTEICLQQIRPNFIRAAAFFNLFFSYGFFCIFLEAEAARSKDVTAAAQHHKHTTPQSRQSSLTPSLPHSLAPLLTSQLDTVERVLS
jgi:hypothetical protein